VRSFGASVVEIDTDIGAQQTVNRDSYLLQRCSSFSPAGGPEGLSSAEQEAAAGVLSRLPFMEVDEALYSVPRVLEGVRGLEARECAENKCTVSAVVPPDERLQRPTPAFNPCMRDEHGKRIGPAGLVRLLHAHWVGHWMKAHPSLYRVQVFDCLDEVLQKVREARVDRYAARAL
jgi:hypothetical protein